MLGAINKLFGKGGKSANQAVLIYLNGTDLEDSVYQNYDLYGFEEAIVGALGSEGEWDGNETGPTETTVFLYGPDAEQMFARIEPVIRDYPLCKKARVVIRQGGPGAVQREVQL